MSHTVLVVDDSPVMRKMIRRALDLARFEALDVIEAGDGREALDTLGRRWVDLVLTDLHMPHMGGVELVEAMRADRLLAAVPVVVVSAEHGQERVAQLERLGVRAYLTKPFTPERIRDLVRAVLHGGG